MEKIWMKTPLDVVVQFELLSKNDVGEMFHSENELNLLDIKNRDGKIYSTSLQTYILIFNNSNGGLRFHSYDDLQEAINHDCVLFRCEYDDLIYPLFFVSGSQVKEILDKHSYRNIISSSQSENKDILMLKLNDDRILEVDKKNGFGTLFLGERGFDIYEDFLKGGR